MRVLGEIEAEIDRLSCARLDLLRQLAAADRPEFVPNLAQADAMLDQRLSELWDERRGVRARIRFGDPGVIVRQARHEERLSRSR